MKLIDPSMEYAVSFEEGIREFKSTHVPGFLNNGNALEDVADYIKLTKLQTQGKGLPEGWVACNTYWLIEQGEFVAIVNIRHGLTPQSEKRGGHIGYAVRPSKQGKGYGTALLKLALEKAKQLGIDRVLITCDKENTASCRVIEKNGGELENEIVVDGVLISRFWIAL